MVGQFEKVNVTYRNLLRRNDKRWFQAYYDEDNDGFKRENDGDF